MLITWGVIAIIAILFGITSLAWAFTKEMAFQSRALPNMEQALGISIGTPYVDGNEVIQYGVKKDGYAYSKGLRTDDILTDHTDDSPGRDVHKTIYNAQGEVVIFHVRRGDETVKIVFDNIPTIDTECPPRREHETLQSDSVFRAFNWLIEKAGGCSL